MGMPRSRTIPDLLDELAQAHPDREALVGGAARYTYQQLRDAVHRAAGGLHALGVRKGDKVAILMGNRPEWIIADLAITLLGGVMVGLNTWATRPELEYLLGHSDTKLLITIDRYLKYDYLAMLDEIAPRAQRLPRLERIVCLSDAPKPGCLPYESLHDHAASVGRDALTAAQRAVAPEDVAYILYTS